MSNQNTWLEGQLNYTEKMVFKILYQKNNILAIVTKLYIQFSF